MTVTTRPSASQGTHLAQNHPQAQLFKRLYKRQNCKYCSGSSVRSKRSCSDHNSRQVARLACGWERGSPRRTTDVLAPGNRRSLSSSRKKRGYGAWLRLGVLLTSTPRSFRRVWIRSWPRPLLLGASRALSRTVQTNGWNSSGTVQRTAGIPVTSRESALARTCMEKH